MVLKKFLFCLASALVLVSAVWIPGGRGADFSVAANPNADTNPAVAYNSAWDQYLVVYEYETSSSNHDIRAVRVDADGSVLESLGVAYTSKSETNPRVAYNPVSNEYIVTYEYAYTDTDHDIRAQRVSAAGDLQGGVIYVDASTTNESAPDVTCASAGGRFLVVWKKEVATGNNDIYGRVFTSTGGAVVSAFAVSSETYNESAPSAAYDSTNNRYLVLWHGKAPSLPPYYLTTYYLIRGRIVESGGGLGAQVTIGRYGWDNFNPRAAWNPTAGEYLVAFDESGGYPDVTVRGQRVDGAAAKVGSIFTISGSYNRCAYGEVVYKAQENEYLVTWEYASSDTNHDVYCRRVNPDGTFPRDPTIVCNPGTFQGDPAVASGAGTFYFAVWEDGTPENIRGEILSRPLAGTGTATGIGTTTATLNGEVLPNGRPTTCWFEYGSDTSYGSQTAYSYPGSGTAIVPVSAGISGLLPNAVYHFRVVAQNSMGTAMGEDRWFWTLDADPTLITDPATSVSSTGATVNGRINPNGTYTTYYFEYGLSPGFGSQTAETSAGSGRDLFSVSKGVSGLLPSETYAFRLVGKRGAQIYYGSTREFTTTAIPPSVSTQPPTDVTPTQVRFNGIVNPNGSTTSCYFKWGPDENHLVTLRTLTVGAGHSAVSKDYLLEGLDPGASGVFQLVAYNGAGTTEGLFQSFSTPAIAPTATTGEATDLGPHAATLHGTVNPGGAAAQYRFEYWVDPRFKFATPWTDAGSGNSDVAVSADLSGLVIDKTYSFRLIAQNSQGTSEGDPLTFHTPAPPPGVVTGAASNITSDSALVSGTVTPNETETVYWFRYWIDGESEYFQTEPQSAGSGAGPVPVSCELNLLIQEKPYRYQLFAQNAGGLVSGDVDSFSTLKECYVFDGMWPTFLRPWFFHQPRDVATDPEGNVYVLDTSNYRVQKFSSDGHLLKAWGGEGSGPGEFNTPMGIAVNAEAVFVADTYNLRIQKFTLDGEYVTQWACPASGRGGSPFRLAAGERSVDVLVSGPGDDYIEEFLERDDGSGIYDFVGDFGQRGTGEGEFQFRGPSGEMGGGIAYWKVCIPKIMLIPGGGFEYVMVCDSALFVADAWNQRVQKIEAGQVTATWGGLGTADGLFGGLGGTHEGPSGIAVDRWGKVYVVDADNYRVQVFKPKADGSGQYEFVTKWGNLWDENAKFDDPGGIAVGPEGAVYVTDALSYAVQKFSGEGERIALWSGNSEDAGRFNLPAGMALDADGNVYVADTSNHRVQKFSPAMEPIAEWYKSGGSTNAFWLPADIVISQGGTAYVLGGDSVQKFTLAGEFQGEWAVALNSKGLAMDEAGDIYVTETVEDRIKKFHPDGTVAATWTDDGNGGAFSSPKSIACDGQGHVYIADADNRRIVKMTIGGAFVTQWGSNGTGPGQFMYDMKGLTVGRDGFVYVSDSHNHRVQKFTPEGRYVTEFGEHGFMPGKLNVPMAVRTTGDGRFYVADTQNHRIQRFKRITLGTGNKAIVVAGGGKENNPLWEATKVCADLASWVLSYKGFGPDQIRYLSSDLTPNPFVDDVQDATLVNLEQAVKSWAADAQGLVLYFVDHGGQGRIRVNGEESLDAQTLGGWLDTLQAGGMNGPVTVVVEACGSGAFAPGLSPGGPHERLVITSTAEGEDAQLAAQGWLSFSAGFWMRVFAGKDVRDAFDGATGSLQALVSGQHPILSAYNTQAEDFYIGNAVGTESSASAGSAGVVDVTENTATITATGVQGAHGISRVWAEIIPPVTSLLSRARPILAFPRVDLSWSAANNRWEAAFDRFDHQGTYEIRVYAMDRDGNTSVPAAAAVDMNPPAVRKAVIVVGGSQAHPDWDAFRANATLVYEALKWQGYSDAAIQFLSPVTFCQGVDGLATKTTLQDAIQDCVSGNAKDMVLYLVGPGTGDRFQVNDQETVSADEISTWLGGLQAVVIYDGDHSGSFVEGLSDTGRIVVTGSSAVQRSYFLSGGDVSFSAAFWSRILNGTNVWAAFLAASNQIRYATAQAQVPQLDDDGDGMANGLEDGEKAKQFVIGSGVRLSPNDPLIQSAGADTNLSGTATGTLWAENVGAGGELDAVWAVITPPRYVQEPGGVSPQEVPMAYNGQSGRYEGTYTGFDHFGTYSAAVFARDTNGNLSTLKTLSIRRVDGPDIYEDDDTLATARWIFVEYPEPQEHNLDVAGDEDWVKFHAVSGATPYEIRISDRESAWTPQITLYDAQGAFQAQQSGDLLTWTCPADGIYHARIRQNPGETQVYGPGTGYNLAVYRPSGGTPGYLQGMVMNQLGQGIAGAMIQSDLVGAPFPVMESGFYWKVVPSGTHTLTVTAPDYQPLVQPGVVVNPQNTTEKILLMSPSALKGDLDGDHDVDQSDADLALQVLAGKNPAGLRSDYTTSGADVNGDNRVGPEEAVYILERLGGARP